jgi:hypothetical protein
MHIVDRRLRIKIPLQVMLDPTRVSIEIGSLMLLAVAACGGASVTNTPSAQSVEVGRTQPTEAEIQQAQKPCGGSDEVHGHDLGSDSSTEAFAPCSKSGPRDYSAIVKIETLDQGVHIIIDATDDEVTLLGPDVRERDAVLVYPKGKGSAAVEVPLMKTKTGYVGDKIVLWDDLGKLTDEGTKIDVAIYDHDQSSHSTEEMHLSLAVSAGKSCEKAEDENMQTINMGAQHGAKAADLTAAQLGAPMRSSSFFSNCGLPDSANADICVAVKKGKPVGVSVALTPANNRLAACIDRATRRLSFPASDALDVVHQRF